MKFGIVLPIQSVGQDLRELWDELREEVVAAENAGFEYVSIPEFHQANAPVLLSPTLLGSALLAITTRIKFAPAVLCGPLHHPVRLAEDFALLDHITARRAILGIGIGHQAPDFAAYGVDRSERAERTDEILEIFDRYFDGKPFSFSGRHYDLTVAAPLATASGHRPEVWVGAHSQNGLERAARFGDAWISDPQRDTSTIAELARSYTAACERHDRTPRIGLFREAFIADSRAECEHVWGPHALAVHRLYYNVGVYRQEFEPWVDEVRDRAAFTFDRIADERFLIGSGDDIRGQVEAWGEATGAEFMLLRIRHPGGPGHQSTMDAIHRFGKEVIGPCASANRSD